MPPSAIRQQPPISQLVTLAKTQQFYWFLGHVFGLLFFLLNTLTGFYNPKSSLKYYRFSLLSVILTYIIVIKQVHFRSGIKLNIRLIKDENVQYLSLAIIFYLSSFVIGQVHSSLYSFMIFAVFHVLTYFQNHLITIFISNIPAQQRLNSIITNFTTKFNQPALFAASNAEIILLIMTGLNLLPNTLLLIFRRNFSHFAVSVVVFSSILTFNKLRYDSNQYTKATVEQMDMKVSQILLQLNNPTLLNFYHSAKSSIVSNLKRINIPKEASKKN